MNITEVNMDIMFKSILDTFLSDGQLVDNEFVIMDLPVCRGDKNLLKIVVSNLISNSVKYSRNSKGRFIEISSEQIDDKNIYWIKDNGVGFDMKYKDKLFNVFNRLHHSDDFEGTGVGLAIVKRIITKHGGQVWAEGKINKGARFGFSIPDN